MKKKLILWAGILLFFGVHQAIAQERIVGKWKTIDDETAKAKSIVDIQIKDGHLEGKVIHLYLSANEDPSPLCEECKGAKKNQPIIGMQIISDLSYDKEGEVWNDGEILDPENGTTYDCKMWIEDGQLKVRGYVAFFYRTQTWERAE